MNRTDGRWPSEFMFLSSESPMDDSRFLAELQRLRCTPQLRTQSNWGRIDADWIRHSGRIQQRWDKLTDDDRALVDGNRGASGGASQDVTTTENRKLKR